MASTPSYYLTNAISAIKNRLLALEAAAPSGREVVVVESLAAFSGQSPAAYTDWPGMTITLPNNATQPQLVRFYCHGLSPSIADVVANVRLLVDGAAAGEISFYPGVQFATTPIIIEKRFPAGSGVKVIKVQHKRAAGTGTYGTTANGPAVTLRAETR